MKKRIILIVMLTILAAALCATAYADMGPKPSVTVNFTGVEGERYYATLLSETDSTGPYCAWDGTSEYTGSDYDIWSKFAEYKDSDGFYFLQEWWDCTESGELSWGYRAPDVYKILVYFPESDIFCVSGIYSGYAFHSRYTADLSGYRDGVMTVESGFDPVREAVGFIFRVAATLAVELAVALLFGYRGKKQVLIITYTNLVTQLALNIMLNVTNFRHDYWVMVMLLYIGMELVILAAESVVYALLLSRTEPVPKRGKAVCYAFVANACSFGLGIVLANRWFGYFL